MMKTRKSSFNVEKQSKKREARHFVSFPKEGIERDQSSITDVNSLRNKGLKIVNESSTNNTPGNYEIIQKESKYSFVVDWQIPKLSERDKNNYK